MVSFKRYILWLVPALMMALCGYQSASAYQINGEASLTASIGSGDFAPFYLYANHHGYLTQSKNILFSLGAFHPLDSTKRFSHSWGAEFFAGASSGADYNYWNSRLTPPQMTFRNVRPSNFWIQQLWGEIKFRQVFLQVGIKPHDSKLLDNKLSSGDLMWSGNARPIPEVRAGFLDFVDIPLTKKWVQIEGVISYNRLIDGGWCRNHYNYYNELICTGIKMCYKRISFRTNPEKPFHVTASAQNVSTFGGTTTYYSDGRISKTVVNGNGFKDYITSLIPLPGKGGGDSYYSGDHKGSWDLKATYRFKNRDELSAYFEWPWEDSSGMAKKNGWDGLWGVQYTRADNGWFKSALVEYLDLTHMSGPFVWGQQDSPNSSINFSTSGGDNYYNNTFYRGYTNFGMIIGTPMVLGSIFQLSGSQLLALNRVRGIHFAACGNITNEIEWLIKAGYRKAWGLPGSMALLHPHHATSVMAEAKWMPARTPGLKFKAQVGFDKGNIPQNAFGFLLGVEFDRSFFNKKH